MRFTIVCAGASALLAAAAVAADANDAKKSIDPNLKVVCKTEDVVGSKIPTRICKTRLQWQQEGIDSRAALDNRRMWQDVKPKVSGN